MVDRFSNHYDVEYQLGSGYFGTVYKVRSVDDGRRYALKVMDLKSKQLNVFEATREYELVKYLDHHNVIAVYKSMYTMDLDGCVQYFAIQMEYCPHGDLRKFLLRRQGMLLQRQKLIDWMYSLSSALEYIHCHDILHRDLKPDNILLDRNHCLKISDFGIARIMFQYYYESEAMGFKQFLAPEVSRNRRYSKKADVYALGRVFICMATVEDLPVVPVQDISERYEDVMHVIESCVQYAPRYRPTSADLCTVLEAFI